MKSLVVWLYICVLTTVAKGETRFFYENTSDFDRDIMSPEDWGLVGCDDRDTCVSSPLPDKVSISHDHSHCLVCYTAGVAHQMAFDVALYIG